MLADLYGNTWEFTHGDGSSEALKNFLNSLDQEKTNRVMRYCADEIAKGNKFAPHLGQLIVFSEEPTENEFFEIMTRVECNEPKGDVETWLADNIRFNLRRESTTNKMRFFKAQYQQAQSLKKMGKLKIIDRQKANEFLLSDKSQKSKNDIEREIWESQHEGWMDPRIARILREGKNHESKI